MANRENGWYWVQVSPLISEAWEAAKHAGGQWFMADRIGPLPDGVIHTVGPRIPYPGETCPEVSAPDAPKPSKPTRNSSKVFV